MRVAIAQYNPTIGDLRGNLARLLAAAANAKESRADLVVAPELALTGYPPRDLLDRPGFVQDSLQALAQLIQQAPMPMLVGTVVGGEADPLHSSGRISNGAVLAHQGQIVACHRKNLLPTYDVFDEARYFTPGESGTTITWGGTRLGISVCEDIWNDKDYWEMRRYDRDPITDEVEQGAELLINLSASPYHRGKPEERLSILQAVVQRHNRPLLYVNQVGGNDSLIFDGRSLALTAAGEVSMRAAPFKEVLLLGNLQNSAVRGELHAETGCWEEDVAEALCVGLRDYLRKCGFDKVVLGLSGGIDSALCAALAVRALGPSKVMGVAMPSRYSSAGSLHDAQDLARRLGIRCDVVPIEPIFQEFLGALRAPFAGLEPDVTEENLQARVRGTLLMGYSNKMGALLLSTGNKSEVAVGYCTLYGDMNGGLSPLSDVYKTDVYAVARYLNSQGKTAPIPPSSITKAPSAELRPNQTDQDSLPPYEVLDAILKSYVERGCSLQDLVRDGHPAPLAQRIVTMVERCEYKRRQMAPGLRISPKAFGEGRRVPMAQRYFG